MSWLSLRMVTYTGRRAVLLGVGGSKRCKCQLLTLVGATMVTASWGTGAPTKVSLQPSSRTHCSAAKLSRWPSQPVDVDPVDHCVDHADHLLFQVACGSHHSLCLTSDGDIFSWGQNNCGQIGSGTTTNQRYYNFPHMVTFFTRRQLLQIVTSFIRPK